MPKPKLFWGMLYVGALVAVCYYAFANQRRLSDAWFLSGSAPEEYTLEVIADDAIRFYAQARQPGGFATAMRRQRANGLRGKRIRLTGYVTTSEIANDAALWMRVDGPEGRMLAFDNMNNRLITGNVEQRRYDIVLDVPSESQYIVYGAILGGGGTLYLEAMRLEVVDDTVPATDLLGSLYPAPGPSTY